MKLGVKLAVSVDRWCVRFTGESPFSWVFARSEGVDYNSPILVTTRGRKTGRDRTVVLPHFQAGHFAPGAIAVVGSQGGLPTDPHWARNLKACPEARIWYERREIPVDVQLLEGASREPLWKTITERAPVYLAYQARAEKHREIPVFVLVAKDGTHLEAPEGPGEVELRSR